MAAITLADMAKVAADSKDSLKLGAIQVWRKASKVMDMMTFSPSDTLSINFLRAKSLPSPAFRKIGDAYNNTKGDVEPLQENLYSFGGNIDIDKVLERSKGIVDGRTFHTNLALEAQARVFNKYYINGSPSLDVDGFVGLRHRLINDLPSAQTINGGGWDVSLDTAQASWQQGFIDRIEALLDACPEADALIMNRQAKLRFQAALRGSGLLATTVDQIGKTWATYGTGGPMLVDIGEDRDETSSAAGTQIILNTETDDGSATTGGDATTIYAVKFGEMYHAGAQLYGLEVTDKGELDDGVTYRTVVDWPIGIYVINPRSIARLTGIVAA